MGPFLGGVSLEMIHSENCWEVSMVNIVNNCVHLSSIVIHLLGRVYTDCIVTKLFHSVKFEIEDEILRRT